jgi:5-methylcytosine-specific restriction endonuclease McrA
MRLKQWRPRIGPLDTNIGTAYSPRDNEDARERKRFYDSRLWQDTRDAKLRRDPLCQSCAVDNLCTPAREVDHRIALAAGGHRTADCNLVSLCTPCHSRKTMAERNGTQLPRIVPGRTRRLVIA